MGYQPSDTSNKIAVARMMITSQSPRAHFSKVGGRFSGEFGHIRKFERAVHKDIARELYGSSDTDGNGPAET